MTDFPLTRYDAMCRAIDEAHAVDELKDIHDKALILEGYFRQAKNILSERRAIEIRLRAERKAGQLLATMEKARGAATPGRRKRGNAALPRSDAPPTLADLGVSKPQSSRWQRLGAVPEETFEKALAAPEKPTTLGILKPATRGTSGTGDNEWYTPPLYIEAARQVLGVIDLDPATSEHGQRTIQAAQFFTADDDGLTKDWGGRIWLNPPYAQPLIAQFVAKLLLECEYGRVKAAIMLTHNYTDTAWFQDAAQEAAAICFTRGRIRFLNSSDEPAAPTQGQAFFYFGEDVAKFAEIFSEHGLILWPLSFETSNEV